MLVHNKSKRKYVHAFLDDKYQLKMITLEPDAHMEIPDNVAKGWLKGGEVVKYADPEKASKEKKALEDENAKLKEELKKAKQQADKKTTKKRTTSKKTKKEVK